MNDEQISQGILDNWLSSQIGVDASKIDKAKVKAGLRMTLDGIEPGILTPGNVDKLFIGAIETYVDAWVDNLGLTAPKPATPAVPAAPFIVGAKPKQPKRAPFSADQVNAEIRRNGGNPKAFPALLLLVLQWAPSLIQMVQMIMAFLNNRNPVVPPTPTPA